MKANVKCERNLKNKHEPNEIQSEKLKENNKRENFWDRAIC